MIIQELSGIHRELGLISLCVKFRNGNIATGQVLDTVQDQDKGLRQWCVCVCVCVYVFSCSVLSTSLRPYGLQPSRLLCPWSFPGKNTGVGCHFLLQGIFLTCKLNPHLLWYSSSKYCCFHFCSHCCLGDCLMYWERGIISQKRTQRSL